MAGVFRGSALTARSGSGEPDGFVRGSFLIRQLFLA
jgi:hypothetical protein